jgi:hypothetical protein
MFIMMFLSFDAIGLVGCKGAVIGQRMFEKQHWDSLVILARAWAARL